MSGLVSFLDEVTTMTGMDCGGEPVLRVIKFVMDLLNVVLFLVPIGLIVMISVDFVKNVIAGKEDEMKKNLNMVIKRIIMAVALFLVNPIVHFSVDLLGDNGVDFAGCIKIALNDDLSQYKIELPEEDYDPIDTDLKSPSGLVPSTGTSENVSDVIEKATSWMEGIAADNKYGYKNDGTRANTYGDNNQFNCIGLVIMGWINGGVTDLKDDIAFSNMTAVKNTLLDRGFRDVTNDVNINTQENLRRGDVLIRVTKINGSTHIAQYVGDGKIVEAAADIDGVNGDSSGNEVLVTGYRNDNWEYVYRYVGGGNSNSDDDSNSSSGSTSSGNTSTNDSNSGNNDTTKEERITIFVGDSRFVGMQTYVGTRKNQEWIAKTGEGYNYLKNTAYDKIKKIIKDGKKYNVVINFGINDLHNVSNYKKLYGEMTRSSVFDNTNIYIVSVNPVNMSLAKKNGYSVTNPQIAEFNNSMKAIGDVSGIDYCDTYSVLLKDGISTNDGIHYNSSTNKKIYNLIMNNCIK